VERLDFTEPQPAINSMDDFDAEQTEFLRDHMSFGVPSDILRRMLLQKFGIASVSENAWRYKLSVLRQELGQTRNTDGEDLQLLTTLLERMRKHDPAGHMRYDYKHGDFDCTLQCVWLMTPSMYKAFLRCGQCLVIDTTCNTNRWGMKLMVVVGVDEVGSTVVLSLAWLLSECTPDFAWVLQRIRSHVGEAAWSAVRCVATDGDDALMSAVKQELPTVKMARCLFHILQNVKTHIHPLLRGKQAADFVSLFFKAAHAPNEASFQEQWEALLNSAPSTRDYMTNNIYPTREHWARAWTRNFCMFGGSTTQRVESFNAVLKREREVHSKTCMPKLLEWVVELTERQAQQRQRRKITEAMARSRHNRVEEGLSSLVRRVLTPYAADKVLAEFNLEYLYSAELQQDTGCIIVKHKKKDFLYHVRLGQEHAAAASASASASSSSSYSSQVSFANHYYYASSCTCGWPAQFLLPCRHILVANRLLGGDVFQQSQCHPRWFLDYIPHLMDGGSSLSAFQAAVDNLTLAAGPPAAVMDDGGADADTDAPADSVLVDRRLVFNFIVAKTRFITEFAFNNSNIARSVDAIYDGLELILKKLRELRGIDINQLRQPGAAQPAAAAASSSSSSSSAALPPLPFLDVLAPSSNKAGKIKKRAAGALESSHNNRRRVHVSPSMAQNLNVSAAAAASTAASSATSVAPP
jgi:hypothetical protein